MLILLSIIAPVVVASLVLPAIRDTFIIHERLYGRSRERKTHRDHH